jgi:AraC-like DNA-binding protein
MKPAIEAMKWRNGASSVHAYRRVAERFEWNWHYHPEIELTLITRGSGFRLVGDSREPYCPGDLVLVGTNLPHTWCSHESGSTVSSHEAMVIQFLPDAFPPALLSLPEFHAIGHLLARAGGGIFFRNDGMERIGHRMRALTRKQGAILWLELAGLLHDLAGCEVRVLSETIGSLRRSFEMGSRLERIVHFIETRCDTRLSLAAVARFAGLTPSSFARYFRKMTGTTFVGFRNICRIQKACMALAESDRSILDISLEAGFLNLANFNRQFRRIRGMTPRDYRNLYRPPKGYPGV